MRRPTLFAALLLMAAGPAAAQNGREHFIQPDTAYDAVHAVQRDAFLVLRDSTSAISAAMARFMGNLGPSSSLAWMGSRAQAVAQSCAQAGAPLAAARSVVESATWPRSHEQDARSKELRTIDAFAKQLSDCRSIWGALASDTNRVRLRESVPFKSSQLQAQLDGFNRATLDYLHRLNITLPPKAPPTP